MLLLRAGNRLRNLTVAFVLYYRFKQRVTQSAFSQTRLECLEFPRLLYKMHVGICVQRAFAAFQSRRTGTVAVHYEKLRKHIR